MRLLYGSPAEDNDDINGRMSGGAMPNIYIFISAQSLVYIYP